MDRQFLENFGLEKAQVDSILDEHSKDIGAKVKEINELRSQIQGFQTSIDEFQNKLETANSTINTLKNSNKDNENLQNKVKEYQDKIKEMQDSFDAERKQNAIIAELQKQDFIDPQLVMHLIDTDKVIKANDGSYSGLSEQIESITSNEKYDYLRKTSQGGNEAAVTPDVNRGGYDPAVGGFEPIKPEPEKPELIGAIIGKEREAQQQARATSAENFWNSLPSFN